MVAAAKTKTKGVKRKATPDPDEDDPNKKSKSLPPFIKYSKTSLSADGKPFKVGDTKTWKNQTWYYCDCPNHRDGVKWHTFSAEDCRTRKRWLKKKEKEAAEALAAEGEGNEAEDHDNDTEPQGPASEGDITTLLATALNAVNGNETLRDIIADALSAAQQE